MNLSRASLALVFISVVVMVTCGCVGQDMSLSAEERAQIRAYADPITDILLEGFNEGNYTLYSRDFSTEMKAALHEAAFEQNRAQIISRIGLYLVRSEGSVTQSGDYVAVVYRADFEREQGVEIRVVFRKGDESHQIYGLWFNSPALRG
jgi:hypothetical protein